MVRTILAVSWPTEPRVNRVLAGARVSPEPGMRYGACGRNIHPQEKAKNTAQAHHLQRPTLKVAVASQWSSALTRVWATQRTVPDSPRLVWECKRIASTLRLLNAACCRL